MSDSDYKKITKAIEYLRSLLRNKKVPKVMREAARSALRKYPSDYIKKFK